MIVHCQSWGPSKTWNADIMVLPLTATGCAACIHRRVIATQFRLTEAAIDIDIPYRDKYAFSGPER